MSDYPEHDKLAAVSEESQAQGELLDWLSDQGVHLMLWDTREEAFLHWSKPINQILAEYHGIDLGKVEAEKRAMLKTLRERAVLLERHPRSDVRAFVDNAYDNGHLLLDSGGAEELR